MEEGFCIPRTHVGVKAFGLVNGAMSSADASQQSIDGTPPMREALWVGIETA